MTHLAVDESEIATFVDCLLRYADENTYVALRGFYHAEGKPAFLLEGAKVNGDRAALVRAAITAAQRCADAPEPIVFAPPVATFSDPRRARSIDLANGLALSVEIDDTDPDAGRVKLESILGPATLIMASGSDWTDTNTGEIKPKLHIHWRLSEPTTTDPEHARLVDARAAASGLVGGDPTAKPTVHPLRWPGSWNRKRAPARMARIVIANPTAEINLGDALDALTEAAGAIYAPPERRPASDPQAPSSLVAQAMQAIPNPDAHYDTWIRMGYAIYRATGGTGYATWETWSAKSPKHDPANTEAAWKRIVGAMSGANPPRQIGAGTIFWEAAKAGWTRPEQPAPEYETDPAFWESLERSLVDEPATSSETPSTPAPTEKRPSTIIDPRNWTAPAPLRQWIVEGWIPRGYVTGLYGDGATGKSLIAQQLLTSVAVNLPWFGMVTKGARAFGFMCEDDEDELHRRQESINRSLRVTMSDLASLRYASRVGADNLLMTFDDRNRGLPTDLMAKLGQYLATYKPDLVVLDTLADIFGGDEIKRAHARMFVQGIGGNIARTFNCGVVICAHPSQTGLQSGKGTGGSTAWNNTFRSRLYLQKSEGNDDLRSISRMKANYGSTEGAISLKWIDGAFIVQEAKEQRTDTLEWQHIVQIFNEIERTWNNKRPLSLSPQTRKDGRYLPLWASSVLGASEKEVLKAGERWLATGHLGSIVINANSKMQGLKVLRRPDDEPGTHDTGTYQDLDNDETPF